MKQAVLLFAMVGLTMACYTKRHQEEFEAFRRKYRKNYATEEEYLKRCLTFSDNYDEIEAHNNQATRNNVEWTMDVNEFSDLSSEEFLSLYTGFNPSLDMGSSRAAKKFSYDPNGPVIPETYDLRELGLVTPVKHQGACGSCYTFATNANFESQLLKLTNWYPHDLSEQSLMECTTGCGNKLCQGGLMTNCYECLQNAKTGVEESHHYPYVSADGNNGTQCKHNPALAKFFVEEYYNIDSNERAIQQAVILYGAISIGMNANSLQSYSSGIFDPLICASLLRNHAVNIVGWGIEKNKKYWIIKNSWGEGWGENGYFRIAMGKDACGVNGMASFPKISIRK